MQDPFAQATQQGQTPQPTPEDTLAATNQALMKKRKQAEDQVNTQNMAAISTAAAMLNPTGKGPQVQVGKAVATPAYAGMCQQFVDDTVGTKERYPTAYATWQAKVQSGQANQGVSGMQPGDIVEFAPDQSNGNMGHAAVVQKDGNLKMATDNGIQTFNLKDWLTYSGQSILGHYTPSK